MARVPIFLIHDELGNIISAARPSKGTKAIILGRSGETVIETEVEEAEISGLVAGKYRIGADGQFVVAPTDDTP